MDLSRAPARARWLSMAALAAAPGVDAQAGDPDFDQFLLQFNQALAADDRAAVAALTQLPFLYAGQPLDSAEFRRVIPELFTPPVRSCLAQTRPVVEDDRYVVFCVPYGFYFGKADGGYRLIEFMADGEQ